MDGLSPQERALLPVALAGGQVFGFEAAGRLTPKGQRFLAGAVGVGLLMLILSGRPRPE